jgi:hypothetical protein
MKAMFKNLEKGALPIIAEEGKEGQEEPNIDSILNSPNSKEELTKTPAFLLKQSSDKIKKGIAAKMGGKDVNTTKLILTLGEMTKPSAIKSRIDKMKVELMITLNERVDAELKQKNKLKENEI